MGHRLHPESMIWTLRLMLFVMLPSFGEGRASRRNLALELLATRQQLAVLQARHPRQTLGPAFKAFWVLLCRLWPAWKDACVLVKPETVIRWHRVGFRLFWSWKSRKRSGRRKRSELIALILQMAAENATWGAPRIHGELLKLGFRVSERTVSRFMPRRGPKGDKLIRARQNWQTFPQNHREVITAMDFLVVPTWNFKPLYVLIILDYGRRIVRHWNVTAHPTAEWLRQQLREAFPFDEVPSYLIHDRDGIFAGLKCFLKAFGIMDKPIAYRSPWQNGTVERIMGSIRRDLLDHVLVLNEEHLRRLLKDYFDYYHQDRIHLGLEKDSPRGRPPEVRPVENSMMKALPRCGGLHHRYTWRQAA